MPLSSKLKADYIELINNQLDTIEFNSLEEFEVAVQALQNILSPNPAFNVPEKYKAKMLTIQDYLNSPEYYVEFENDYAEYQQIIRSRIEGKISELQTLNTAEKQAYIQNIQEARTLATRNQAIMAQHKPPEPGSAAHTITEEEWHAQMQQEEWRVELRRNELIRGIREQIGSEQSRNSSFTQTQMRDRLRTLRANQDEHEALTNNEYSDEDTYSDTDEIESNFDDYLSVPPYDVDYENDLENMPAEIENDFQTDDESDDGLMVRFGARNNLEERNASDANSELEDMSDVDETVYESSSPDAAIDDSFNRITQEGRILLGRGEDEPEQPPLEVISERVADAIEQYGQVNGRTLDDYPLEISKNGSRIVLSLKTEGTEKILLSISSNDIVIYSPFMSDKKLTNESKALIILHSLGIPPDFQRSVNLSSNFYYEPLRREIKEQFQTLKEDFDREKSHSNRF